MTITSKHSYYTIFSQLIQLEAEAISKASALIDPLQIELAVKFFANLKGKAIFTGVGKSGIIAKKIAATLTSIGVPSVFLHPSEALHGDIGIIRHNDLVFLISNSGETSELLTIIPYIKQRNVPIIALLGNTRSSIARCADVIIAAVVEKEACPLNLAPTSSTTVALVVGDALAMTLMQVMGLTIEDFALNHPAGQLGKRLTLRVADLMHSNRENPTIPPQANWLEIVTAISQGGLGAVNIIDSTGHLMGLITDGDLRRALEKYEPSKLANLHAYEIMTSDPITMYPEQLAYEALKIMENRNSQISVVPVIDQDQYCVGLLRLHDIARSGLV